MKVFNFAISKWNDSTEKGHITIERRITPIQAEILLRNNVNRPQKIAKQNQYERDMRAGKWFISNDIICFDENGALLNGQNRLKAVIKSGEPQSFIVGFGFTKEEQQGMDNGKTRNFYDVLTLSNGQAANKFAASISRFVRCQTICGKARKATREEELSFFRTHEANLEYTSYIFNPPDINKTERTGLAIGNDVAAGFFRAISANKNNNENIYQIERLATALISETENNNLSALVNSNNDDEMKRAVIFRLYKKYLGERKTLRRKGQDQGGRDYMYRITEKAIHLFLNPPKSIPERIVQSNDELFLLEEETQS